MLVKLATAMDLDISVTLDFKKIDGEHASFYRYDIGGDCDCGWHERGQLF